MIALKLILLLLICPSLSCAAPTISTAIVSGDTVTIYGNGFGTKISPSPIDYLGDNIESGVNGEPFSKPSWTSDTSTSPKYSTLSAHSGTKSLYYNLTGDYTQRSISTERAIGDNDEVYMSLWIRTVESLGTCNTYQYKGWRIKNNSGYNISGLADGTGTITDMWRFPGGYTGNSDIQQYGSGTILNSINLTSNPFTNGVWERYDIHYKHSAPSIADGSISIERVGTGSIITGGESGLVTRSDASHHYKYLRLMAYFINLKTDGVECDDPTARLEVFYDDVYIDSTQSRVELCNADRWENVTHCEAQIASSWADDAISVSANMGSFDSSDGLYFFVINANGEASEGVGIDTPTSLLRKFHGGLRTINGRLFTFPVQ